jgi:oligopeptide/dipeptide ABC transporter ATP-binding protein
MTAPLLRVTDLRKHYAVRRGGPGWRKTTLAAVAGVSFTIESGRTLGLVGESGCGKTTLGRLVVRLLEPTAGEIELDGEPIARMPRAGLRSRRHTLQMIFQDSHASLDPRYTVARTLREPLDVHGLGDRTARERRVRELLDVVALPPDIVHRHPHELSGGQRQRVGIARALALGPRLVVADEPVSSLDVTVRAQVLDLLAGLQRERGIAYLFISHDLGVVRHVSDDVAVMYLGRIVEHAPAEALFRAPAHPYTQALLSAVPSLEVGAQGSRVVLRGDVPSAATPPAGCPFHPRCPHAMAVCREHEPPGVNVGTPEARHVVRCHLHTTTAPRP